ncbi:hypothetical protein K503DRAFT_850003 [Rhizopogon vinicolor AM-OR11-026]|uniref:Uncharacterized protein n=1 Tax=Rhizopogon vinicolor AM-OR11-026 TaxID=1314800 RepID=A0A1B7N0R3_9AGAM|nr:hypothetical protein K503DRAFT_850003 [Rhizopogon vinicolor AM-OR11-026]
MAGEALTSNRTWNASAGLKQNKTNWLLVLSSHIANKIPLLVKNGESSVSRRMFDNAITHLKHADDALSARKMPKRPKNWGVEMDVVDENGKPIKKVKVRMCDATFADGSPQSLYYPEGHELAGVFTGMAVILHERGRADVSKVRAECPKFQCKKSINRCCCRSILYNEPYFVNVGSLLEIACEARGFRVIFFPKIHCELNFIEQCWGYSKRVYRELPVSSKEADFERNFLAVLESIPLFVGKYIFGSILLNIDPFDTRSLRFMDAYHKGLNGKQAAWASKQYRDHGVLPDTIMAELETAKLT